MGRREGGSCLNKICIYVCMYVKRRGERRDCVRELAVAVGQGIPAEE